MKLKLKPILMDVACVLFFAVIASVYFYPAFKGWRLTGEDNSANDGLKIEINQYRESHDGETPRNAHLSDCAELRLSEADVAC